MDTAVAMEPAMDEHIVVGRWHRWACCQSIAVGNVYR